MGNDIFERTDSQTPSRTKLYRDKANGKVMGVSAGIADYAGFDVTLVRVCMVAALFLSGGGTIPFYVIAAMIMPKKPAEFDYAAPEEQQFWQSVRQSPSRTARDIRSRLREIDRRLADIESYVTTENRSLAREIEQLR
jgi:phage shock protein C